MQVRRVALLVAVSLGVALVPVVAADAEGGPTVTVEPAAGLVDQQTVAISGQDFGANVVVGLAQCSAEVITDFQNVNGLCFLPNATSANTTSTGVFGPFNLVVRRFITIGTDADQRTIDCAQPNACLAGAAELGNLSVRDYRTLTFAGAAPSISASPSVGLRDGQSVSVTGSDFLPIADLGHGPQPGRVTLSVCLADVVQHPLNAADLCSSSSSEAAVAPDGRIAASVTAFRTSTSVGGTTVDCTTGPERCVLFAQQIVGFSSPLPIPDVINASVPIGFRAERFSDCRGNGWTTFTDGKGRHFRSPFACVVYVFVSWLRQLHR